MIGKNRVIKGFEKSSIRDYLDSQGKFTNLVFVPKLTKIKSDSSHIQSSCLCSRRFMGLSSEHRQTKICNNIMIQTYSMFKNITNIIRGFFCRVNCPRHVKIARSNPELKNIDYNVELDNKSSSKLYLQKLILLICNNVVCPIQNKYYVHHEKNTCGRINYSTCCELKIDHQLNRPKSIIKYQKISLELQSQYVVPLTLQNIMRVGEFILKKYFQNIFETIEIKITIIIFYSFIFINVKKTKIIFFYHLHILINNYFICMNKYVIIKINISIKILIKNIFLHAYNLLSYVDIQFQYYLKDKNTNHFKKIFIYFQKILPFKTQTSFITQKEKNIIEFDCIISKSLGGLNEHW